MTHCSPSFNVDGAVGGKLGPAGISCVVLKASGDVVAAFSSPMGVKDGSNKAKMLVRREALRILYQSLKLADKFGFSFLWLPHLQFFLCYCADAATFRHPMQDQAYFKADWLTNLVQITLELNCCMTETNQTRSKFCDIAG